MVPLAKLAYDLNAPKGSRRCCRWLKRALSRRHRLSRAAPLSRLFLDRGPLSLGLFFASSALAN